METLGPTYHPSEATAGVRGREGEREGEREGGREGGRE